MKLTRAQVVSLCSIANNSPINAELEVVDHNVERIMVKSFWHLNASLDGQHPAADVDVLWRLPHDGGYSEVSRKAPAEPDQAPA